jgi:sulfatase maturation enzyme AslB (radical SAM superfamily)
MSWETFQRVADKFLAAGQTRVFSFSGFGEPLLNRNIGRFVAHVSPYAETFLSTNGSLLDEKRVNELLAADLNHLILSFNGADAATYERIMTNLCFEQTLAAIERLHRLGGTQINLMANVTVSSLTRDQLPAMKSLLADMGIDQVIYSHCHHRGGSLGDEELCMPLPPAPDTRCDIFAGTTFVAWDGQVLACCHDLKNESVIGDLLYMPVEELVARRRRIEKKGVDFPMCAECDDLYRLAGEEPPPGGSLSEWVYRLYESEDSRLGALTQSLRLAQKELADLKTQNAHIREQLLAYEQGRFIRFMRWLHRRIPRLSGIGRP